MKNKIIKSLLLSIFALFVFVGTSFAATSVRLQTPPSQTNDDSFTLTFVALDTDSSQTITVKCFKSGPGDSGSFSQFGSDIVTSAGGNTDTCDVSLNQGNGTYSFYATAQGTSSSTSSTVSTDFNNSTPGTPTNYSKSKQDDCTYKISFRTADDGGKTVKVNLYRSSDTSFNVDSAHQVNSVNIGSNTDGSMTDNVSPNCNTTYYYVIRAFDTYGNGSGVIGDSNVTTTIVNPTTTVTQGAIPVGGTGTGSVLGEGAEATGQGGEVLATESAQPSEPEESEEMSKNPLTAPMNWIAKNWILALSLLILIAAIAYYVYRNRNTQ